MNTRTHILKVHVPAFKVWPSSANVIGEAAAVAFEAVSSVLLSAVDALRPGTLRAELQRSAVGIQPSNPQAARRLLKASKEAWDH